MMETEIEKSLANLLPVGLGMRKKWERGGKEEEKNTREREGKNLAFLDCTNCFQEPVSAESISSPTTISFPRSYARCVSSLNFSISSYDPTGVTIGEVLPAVCLPSLFESFLLQHPGSYEPTQDHSRTHCSLVGSQKLPFSNQTNSWVLTKPLIKPQFTIKKKNVVVIQFLPCRKFRFAVL